MAGEHDEKWRTNEPSNWGQRKGQLEELCLDLSLCALHLQISRSGQPQPLHFRAISAY